MTEHKPTVIDALAPDLPARTDLNHFLVLERLPPDQQCSKEGMTEVAKGLTVLPESVVHFGGGAYRPAVGGALYVLDVERDTFARLAMAYYAHMIAPQNPAASKAILDGLKETTEQFNRHMNTLLNQRIENVSER